MNNVQLRDEYAQMFKRYVKSMKVDDAVKVAEDANKSGMLGTEFIGNVVMPTVEEVWAEYRRGKSGLPGPVICMFIARKSVDLFKNQLPPPKAKVVVGTTRTSHDVGKNLVKEMLYLYNYDVYDIHSNATPEAFVSKALEVGANIIACSCMALIGRPNTRTIVEKLKEAGIRNKIKYMVGGAVMTPAWAIEIGADGYGDTMMDAAVIADRFVEELSKDI